MARVLVVDSDVATRQAIALELEPVCDVVAVRTAGEARAAVRGAAVELVIVEYRLPGASGLDLLAELGAHAPGLPVIMVTGSGSESVCASALRLGARDYLTKPLHMAELRRSFRRILSIALPHQDAPPSRELPDGERNLRIRRAATFFEHHYSEHVVFPDVARSAGMGQSTFSRAFKVLMRMSPRTYVTWLRISKARQLLAASRYSVTEIAQMVGFGDLPRFDRVFKRETGLSPSRFRRSALRKAESDNSSAGKF